jgi:hypothetical protein
MRRFADENASEQAPDLGQRWARPRNLCGDNRTLRSCRPSAGIVESGTWQTARGDRGESAERRAEHEADPETGTNQAEARRPLSRRRHVGHTGVGVEMLAAVIPEITRPKNSQ